MAKPAQVLLPLEIHLLDQLLEAEAPDLESSDERLEKVNGLVARSAYVEAARAAEALLRQGLYDVRLVGPYLLGLFLERGLGSMPVVFHSLSSTLLRNWQFFGPRVRKDVFADTGLRWLLKVLNRHLEHHERLKDAIWERWRDPSNREPLEQALALSEEIFSALGSVMPRNGCEAPFRRLTQWLEGHVQALPNPKAELEPEPEPESEPELEPEADEAAPEPPSSKGPLARGGKAPQGPTVPVSPALADLMRKLAAFDTLIERQDFRRASVVAADVLSLVERFDPRVYLPLIFSRFFAGLSTHAETVEPLLQGTDSLSFRALDHLYRVDLDTFLEPGSEPSEQEE